MNIYNLYKIGCKNPVYNNLNNVKMEQIFVSEIKGKFLYFHIVNYYKGSCLRVGIIGSDILLFNYNKDVNNWIPIKKHANYLKNNFLNIFDALDIVKKYFNYTLEEIEKNAVKE